MPLGNHSTARPVAASSCSVHRCPTLRGLPGSTRMYPFKYYVPADTRNEKVFFLLIHLKGTANAERAMMSAAD